MLPAPEPGELRCRKERAEEMLLRMVVKREEPDDCVLVTFTLVPGVVEVALEGGRGRGRGGRE